jgi:hypothetical protein
MTKIFAFFITLAIALVATPVFAGGPVSGPQARAHITQRLQYSSKVVDKTRPFTTRLGGKKGDVVRPFSASNVRGQTITIGNVVTGQLDTRTGAVRTLTVTSPR